MDKFALLVPCFNAEKYILGFLESLNDQKKKFDEVLFYDDGSADNTLSVLKQLGQTVVEGGRNRGPAFARNVLARTTKCNWFHFHDVDDFLAPDYLEKVSKRELIENFEVILCDVDWINENKKDIVLKWRYKNDEIQKDPICYTLSNPIGGINGLYKKGAFERIKGFDENLQMWEDADLHVRLAISGSTFYVYEEVLSFSVRYSSSQSTDQKKASEYRLTCLEKYKNLLQGCPAQIKVLGSLAENLTSTFIHQENMLAANNALELTKACGINYPSTDKLLWKVLKATLPKWLVAKIRFLHLATAFGINRRISRFI